MGAHASQDDRSEACALMDHEQCRRWKSCLCPCHNRRKLLNNLKKNRARYDECPF